MLDNLPDEITVEIVKLCVEPRNFARATLKAPPLQTSKPYEALKWSHLSRRHRVLMRDTPSLWSWVSSAMHPIFLRECLKLSGGHGLDVEINAEYCDLEFASLRVINPPSSDRWVSLILRINLMIQAPHEDQTQEKAMKMVREFYINLGRLKAPNLSRLNLVYEVDEDDTLTFDLKWSVRWFKETCSSWSVPQLREIVTNGGDESLPGQLAKSLQKLTINLDTVADIEIICGLVSTLCSVRELCIRMSKKLDDFIMKSWIKPCCMPSVSTFRLEWEVEDSTSVDAIDTFLTWVLFPNLASLQIQLIGSNAPDDQDLELVGVRGNIMDTLLYDLELPNTLRFPTISAFEMQVDGSLPSLPKDWTFPAHEFNELRHLVLDGVQMVVFSSDDGKDDCNASRQRTSKLQNITLRGCDKISTEGFVSFIKPLQEIKEVTVVQCKSIDDTSLSTALQGIRFLFISG